MDESALQKVYNYPINPGDSKTYSDKGFINLDIGAQVGTHWTCFYIKNNKFYFNSFGGQPHIFALTQLPKPTIYHNLKYKI